MREIYIILRREFLLKISAKSFYLFVLVTPLLFMLPVIMNVASNIKKGTDRNLVAVINTQKNEYFTDSISYRGLLFFNSEAIDDMGYYLNQDGVLGVIDLANKGLTDNNLSKIVIKYYTSDSTINYRLNDIESFLNQTYHQAIMERFSLEEQVRNLEIYPLKIDTVRAKREFLSSSIAFILGLLIYIILILFNNSILKSVSEEKSSNLLDVLSLFIRPRKIMMGKIVGLTLISLIQFILWILIFLIYLFILNIITNVFLDTGNAPPSTFFSNIRFYIDSSPSKNFLLVIVVFFVLGFLLNGVISSILGMLSIRSNSNHFLFLGNILSLGSMYFAMFAAVNPESTIIKYAKFVPFFNYLIIPTLMPYGIKTIDVVIALMILLLTVVISVIVSVRFYEKLIYN